MDALSVVVDEVSLEGLDGITIPSLWVRLKERKPAFPLKLDVCTKEFIWRSLVSNSELRFYELPGERADVEVFNRFKNVDEETGFEIPQEDGVSQSDIYPVKVVESKDGIQGSCVFFRERKDITNQVRSKSSSPLMTLEEALKIFGRKMVIVASQILRFRVLIGPEGDPDLKLTGDSYCVLERVGRARWQGELQCDLHKGVFTADPRKFHYLRLSLVRNDLITTQPYFKRLKNGQTQYTVLLLLKCYHVVRRSKQDQILEYVSNFLQKMPGQLVATKTLKNHLNLSETGLTRVFKALRASKMTELVRWPLEDLYPDAGPCINRNGLKVRVQCVKLVKPFSCKNVADEDDNDEDDDEDEQCTSAESSFTPEARVLERDIITQAYHLVLSYGSKGIPQRDLQLKMNISGLEARMILRKLEREGIVKGFMEDEGRQRTTKYISHKFVNVSDQVKMFEKEQERNKQLFSAALQANVPKTPSTSKSSASKKRKIPSCKKDKKAADKKTARRGRPKGGSRKTKTAVERQKDEAEEVEISREVSLSGIGAVTPNTQPEHPIAEASLDEGATPSSNEQPPISAGAETLPRSAADPVPEEAEKGTSTAADVTSPPNCEQSNAEPSPLKENTFDTDLRPDKCKETYRLLRRRNLIVEAVQTSKIIEGTFPLQKIIKEAEMKDGFDTKCCKKTLIRLVQSLSRKGLLKMYSTTVIQEGISRKVDIIVHPSVQPNDERIAQLIEQIRFRISSSYSKANSQQASAKDKESKVDENLPKSNEKKAKTAKKQSEEETTFKPIRVAGMGKSLGYQPKMCRLRATHSFLFHVMYDHPLLKNSVDAAQTTDENKCSVEDLNLDFQDQSLGEGESGNDSSLDKTLESVEDDDSNLDPPECKYNVYVNEDSWKRFVPPVRIPKGFTKGWAMVGELLLCLPLSVFVQIIQVTYKVDNLEEYLNDPVKQHYLVRVLPARMQRQLLYKRKYIFVFHENLQRLVYMGLMQFGVAEKFKDKDQLIVHLNRKASIVDTTNSEPHYSIVKEPHDKPFERRHYTFNTEDDVKNYWFDLMCVCLNTPLGLFSRRDEGDTSSNERHTFPGLAYLLKGSFEVYDDGSIPGDGKGAGGLDSEFFGHLKRNWLWISQLATSKKRMTGSELPETKRRLTSLLNNPLRLGVQAGGPISPHHLTIKQTVVTEDVEVAIEPASRNLQVVGGKGQKRKRTKKEIVKMPRKKKKSAPKKRGLPHDEADHRALKMMTKQRVQWSAQEDALIMLCSVASNLLNSKLVRPFVAHCVVRDMLHAEFKVSMDKTSIAVGRRARYILKNPQTLLNYKVCLAEIHQDKALTRYLEENKPVDHDSAQDCAKAFSEYVRVLRQKFSPVLSTAFVVIPDSKEELFSRFKVSGIDDGKHYAWTDNITCTKDIQATVLLNLIQSTLATTTSQMKFPRSSQTFYTFSKYDQELLCKVFIQCRKRHLINRRRYVKPLGRRRNRAVPILPMSYQLSQSFYRSFSWRFPHSLCTDSFRFLRTIIANKSADKKPVISFYHETEKRSPNGEQLERGKESARKEEVQAGEATCRAESQKCAEVVSLETLKKGEDDQTKADNEEEGAAPTKKKEEADATEISEKAVPPEDAQLREKQGDDAADVSGSSDSTTEAPQPPPDVSDMLPFSLNSPGGACAVNLSLLTLGLLNVHMSIPKQMVLVDSNLVDNNFAKNLAALEEEDDDDDGEENEVAKKRQVTAHQASHTNYLIMQGFCAPGIVKLRNLSATDNIVVESCAIRLQLRNIPAHNLFTEEGCPPLDLTKCGPSLLPSILTRSIRSSSSTSLSEEECNSELVRDRGYTPQDIDACAELKKCLNEVGVNGMEERELYTALAHLQEPESGRTRGLKIYLQDLQEREQVLRVGSLSARWVLVQHAEPWLLTVNSKQSFAPASSSETSPFLESQHNIPFFRKRRSAGRHEADEAEEPGEPSSKKPAMEQGSVDEAGSKDGHEFCRTETSVKETKLEEQLQMFDKEGGEKSPIFEETEELPVHSEKDEEKEEHSQTKKREESSMELRSRKNADREKMEPSSSLAKEEDTLIFISRPWRLIDGKVNRPVCKGMLEGVLYHIMSRPGLTQQALLEHYRDKLQPVAVLELVQALIELGCVVKKNLVKTPKPTLFRSSANQRPSERTIPLDEPDKVFYEPTISCCLRLCQVLPNERHWNDGV